MEESVLITRGEFENWMRVINKKLDMLSQDKKSRFITRKEIIDENGVRFYEKVKASIQPIKNGKRRNTIVRFERKEYERFIEQSKMRSSRPLRSN
jgi:hypothetical protein